MPFDTNPREHDTNATRTSWLAPLSMLVAWLASLLNSIARLKRIRATTRFKPHWTQSWTDLRRLEWHRDQLLAQGAALFLAGKTLDDAEGVLTDPPDDYGGPCPRTPFQMQRRFLAITAWLKDLEGHIRRHAARIAKRADASNHDVASLSAPARGEVAGARLARLTEGTAATRPNARGPPAHPTMFENQPPIASPAPPAETPHCAPQGQPRNVHRNRPDCGPSPNRVRLQNLP